MNNNVRFRAAVLGFLSLQFPFLKRFPSLLFMLVLCVPAGVQSAQVSGLYSAQVPVESQSEALRASALAEALKQVLIKISGDEAALYQSNAISLVDGAERYVLAFSYLENPAYVKALSESAQADSLASSSDAGLPISPEPLPESEQLSEQEPDGVELPEPFLLDVSFSRAAVENALSSYGVAIWGHTRPSLLVWLVDERQGERRLLGASDEDYVEELKQEADNRALPLFFPVVDLADLSSVDLNELWGLYPDAVSTAAARYQSDLNLLIRKNPHVAGETGSFSADWAFRFKGLDYAGTATGESMREIWRILLSDVSTILAARYAVVQRSDQEPGWLNIEIDRVLDFQDYASVQRYLRSLPSVGKIELKWVQGTRLAYRLELKGQREQFFEYLELGGRLQWVARTPEPDLLMNAQGQSEMDALPAPQTGQVAAENFLWRKQDIPGGP